MNTIKPVLIAMLSASVAMIVLKAISKLLTEIPEFTQGWICCAVFFLVIEYVKELDSCS